MMNAMYSSLFKNYGDYKYQGTCSVPFPRSFIKFDIVEAVLVLGSAVPPRKLINSWMLAKEFGCLRSYFGDIDFLEITIDEKQFEGFDFSYNGDYFDFCKTLIKANVVLKYRIWMGKHLEHIKIGEQDYSSPLTFAKYMEQQFLGYLDVIKNIDLQGRFFLYSR